MVQRRIRRAAFVPVRFSGDAPARPRGDLHTRKFPDPGRYHSAAGAGWVRGVDSVPSGVHALGVCRGDHPDAVVASRHGAGRLIGVGRYGDVPANRIHGLLGTGIEAAQSHSGSVAPMPR